MGSRVTTDILHLPLLLVITAPLIFLGSDPLPGICFVCRPLYGRVGTGRSPPPEGILVLGSVQIAGVPRVSRFRDNGQYGAPDWGHASRTRGMPCKTGIAAWGESLSAGTSTGVYSVFFKEFMKR